MRLQLAQKIRLTTQPQRILCSQLLQVSGAELEQLVQNELDTNPALEDELTAPRLDSGYGLSGPGMDLEQIAAPTTPLVQLEMQIAFMGHGATRVSALRLLAHLDHHGYLREKSANLCKELDIDETTLDSAIDLLHQLEPPGIGARNLRECLLIQCAYLQERGIECKLAQQILRECWADLPLQRWVVIARKLAVSENEVSVAVTFIRSRLHPYPLNLFPQTAVDHLLQKPDMIIRRAPDDETAFVLDLPGETFFNLQMNEAFTRLSSNNHNVLSPAEAHWLETYLQRARLFLYAWQKRWETLRRIGNYLVEQQSGFLQHGPRYLKPLTRVALAEELGIHSSTVSRAVKEKVVQLPSGQLTLLSDFFDGSLPAKTAMRYILAQADSKLSDHEIAQQLQGEGIRLARRTV
ncbi:MAG: hypothetical protein ACK2UK_06345, partial [Candidatus Promineifilaceae bacterium]